MKLAKKHLSNVLLCSALTTILACAIMGFMSCSHKEHDGEKSKMKG